MYNFISQWYMLRPQGRTGSCSSLPVDAIPFPDFTFNPSVHPRKVPLLWNSGSRGALFHNRHKFCSHRSHAASILDTLCRIVQSVLLINRLAFLKLAWAYLQMVRLLGLTGRALRDHFKVTSTPLWSELLNGVVTQQFTNCEGTGSSTRSNRVELPELLKWVGWGTTCVKYKTL